MVPPIGDASPEVTPAAGGVDVEAVEAVVVPALLVPLIGVAFTGAASSLLPPLRAAA